VIFNGIPILAPGTTQATRYYRITNVRINANGLTAGLAGTTPVTASIAVSPTNLPIATPLVTAGFVQNGLSASVGNLSNSAALSNPTSFNQCNSMTFAGAATLRFSENFGTAFKTRVAATNAYNGQAGTNVLQNVPGTIYNSESGFINPNVVVGSTTAGLADFGTRLKATFANIPAGVRIFVSTTNISGNGAIGQNGTNAPALATATNGYAVLVNGETTSDSPAGIVPTLPAGSTLGSGIGVVEITPSGGGGSGTAVWEVINTNPNQIETFTFGVWVSYTANTAQNLPAPGTAGQVTLSFAPTSTVTTASTGPVPRFAVPTGATNVVIVNICQTYLLFPFVTNLSGLGMDTGIAVANTSTDPSTIGTGNQSGKCDAFFYGGTTPPAAKTDVFSGSVDSGKVGTFLLSSYAAGFQGYMIIRCDFQYAHGFAFISDIGIRNYAMGYLALVMQNGSLSRGTSAEALGN
jgi:hypothetical protein